MKNFCKKKIISKISTKNYYYILTPTHKYPYGPVLQFLINSPSTRMHFYCQFSQTWKKVFSRDKQRTVKMIQIVCQNQPKYFEL